MMLHGQYFESLGMENDEVQKHMIKDFFSYFGRKL